MSAFASKLMSGVDCAASPPPTATATAASAAQRKDRKGRKERSALMSAPSLPAARGRRRRAQPDLLHAPRGDLGDVELVGRAAVHLVDAAEFLEAVTRFAEPPEHGPIELHLVDLAGHRRLIEVVP